MLALKRVLVAIASVGIGAGLIALLLRFGHVDLVGTLHQIGDVSGIAFAKLVFLNALLIWISTQKWRLVDKALREPSDATPSRTAAFTFTSAGMALGFLLPVQLGMATARTLGTWFHGRPFARGTAATIFEQSFDMLVLCFLALPSAITWYWHGEARMWTFSVVAMMLLALMMAEPSIRLLRWSACFLASRLRFENRFAAGLRSISGLQESRILSPALARTLIVLSAIRFAVLVLMAEQVATGTGLRIAVWRMSAALPFAAIANVIAITPGGVGINELTSTAVLAGFGIPLTVAAKWSLANRVLLAASSFTVAACALVVAAVRKLAATDAIQVRFRTEAKGGSC